MIPSRNTFILSLFVVLVLVFVGYFFWDRLGSHEPVETREITVSPKWVNQAQFAGMFVAIERGFYKKYGLQVHVREFSDESSPIQDLTEGISQFAYLSANETLTAHDQGLDIKALAAIYQITPFAVASLTEQKIQSPSDLRGKVLATKGGPGSESESIYDILLASSGLRSQDVTFTYLPFGTSEYQDLIDRRADAIGLYRTDQLYPFIKASRAYTLLQPESFGGAVYNDVIVASASFVEKHPNTVKAFLKATQEGWEYALRHPEAAIDATMPYVTNPSYADRAYESFILEKSIPLIQPNPETAIGEMNLERWSMYCDRLQTLGLLSRPCAVPDFVDLRFLP